MLSTNFEEFDFGPDENMRRYGHPDARPYNLDAIKTPTYLVCGKGDLLGSPGNYRWLIEKLKQNQNNVLLGVKEYEAGHVALTCPDNEHQLLNILE